MYSLYCLTEECPQDFASDVDSVYRWAMTQTVMLAGDSDTNAAIVGGVIGAYVGISHIEQTMVKKLLSCRLKLVDKDKPLRGN